MVSAEYDIRNIEAPLSDLGRRRAVFRGEPLVLMMMMTGMRESIIKHVMIVNAMFRCSMLHSDCTRCMIALPASAKGHA